MNYEIQCRRKEEVHWWYYGSYRTRGQTVEQAAFLRGHLASIREQRLEMRVLRISGSRYVIQQEGR